MQQPGESERGGLPQPYGQTTALAPVHPTAPRGGGDSGEGLSLADYLGILVRRRWLMTTVVATVLVVAALQVFTTTPQYRATVTLQIDPEDFKVLPYEEIAQSGGSQRQLEEYLWTQAEKLRTRSLAQRVVERLELAADEAFTEPARKGILVDLAANFMGSLRRLLVRRERSGEPSVKAETALAERFSGHLQVRLLRNTRLIKVSFDSPSQKLAADVANTLAEEFIEQHLESKFNATVRATDFLHKQLEDLKVGMEQSEQNLHKYAQDKKIVNLDEQRPISRKRLEDINDELTRIQGELVAQRVRYDALRSAEAGALPDLLKNETIRGLEANLGELQGELAGLSGRYGPEWPRVKELRLKITELGHQLAQENARVRESAASEYRLARTRYDRLAASLEDQRQVVDRLGEDSIQYRVLKREVDTNKELYEGLLQRLKEAGVAAGLRSSNIRIADPAVVPRLAAAPNKSRSLALALVLGTLLGIGAALVAEVLDNTVKSTEDVVTQLGLPALGVIPSLGATANGHKAGRWGALLSTARRQRFRRPVLAHESPKTMRGRAWEAYRSLRTALLLSHSEKPPQVIVVTSALPGEGKTTTAANTAMALAQTGARTVVVDLDLRKPALAATFDLDPDKGMSTYLSGHTDLSSLVRETRLPNLYAIGAGPPAPNPPDLLGSPRMAKGLELLREYFQYIVIDTPPGLELSDALILSARGVDGVLLVARGGRTPLPALRKTGENLHRVGARILGVLLNDVDMRLAHYGDYYGYYGGYYKNYFGPEAEQQAEPPPFSEERPIRDPRSPG